VSAAFAPEGRPADTPPDQEGSMTDWNQAALGTVDDHFISKYRSLLDAESAAFDELEHAYEDGDRAHFETDLAAWRSALERRASFLDRHGLVPSVLNL
jgi:hypothetical protein